MPVRLRAPSPPPPFDAAVEAALRSPSTPATDASLLRGCVALGRWSAAGLSALSRHEARCGSADGEAAVRALLRDGGAAWRAEVTALGSRSGGAAPAVEDAADAAALGVGAVARRQAWREEALARAAHREYNQLVAGLPGLPDASPAVTFSSFRQQLSLGGAAFAGLFTAVSMGYYLGRLLYGGDDGRAWTVALFCGILLLVVEMLLLVIQLHRMDSKASSSAPGVKGGQGGGRNGGAVRAVGAVAAAPASGGVKPKSE